MRLAELLGKASLCSDSLQVVQSFRRGRKIPMTFTEEGQTETVDVRIRLTPYLDPATGNIIDLKATGRAGTDLIHGSSDSINSPVRVI